jgi:hypothetical protein
VEDTLAPGVVRKIMIRNGMIRSRMIRNGGEF